MLLSLINLSSISSGFENATLSRADLAEASVIIHLHPFCCASVSAEKSTEAAIIVAFSKNRRCLTHSGLAVKVPFGAGWRGESVQIRGRGQKFISPSNAWVSGGPSQFVPNGSRLISVNW